MLENMKQKLIMMDWLFSKKFGQKVLMLNAGCFIIVHNHPSGDSTPSSFDIEMFKTISVIGDFIGIPLKDSIILGLGTYYSFSDNNGE